MTNKESSDNVFFFLLGLIPFIVGMSGMATLISALVKVSINLGEMVVILICSSFFIYCGLAFLLQAGLGSFWNDMHDLSEVNGTMDKQTSVSADASPESN